MERKLSNFTISFVSLLSVLALAFSCSSPSEDEESNTATADTSVPTVTAISPADDTTDVSVKSTISITFSKSIKPANLTVSTTKICSGTMQLSVDGFNNCVPVVVSYDSSRKIYTMTSGSSTAAQELNSLPKHQIKTTTSEKDYLDVSLARDCNFTGFTTASVCYSACSWSYACASGLTAGSGHAVVRHLGRIWII